MTIPRFGYAEQTVADQTAERVVSARRLRNGDPRAGHRSAGAGRLRRRRPVRHRSDHSRYAVPSALRGGVCFFCVLIDCVRFPAGAACSKFNLNLIGPDFTAYKADDPFKGLGPIAIFSARRHWSAPRSVRLQTGTAAMPAAAAAAATPQQSTASRYYVHSRGADPHRQADAATAAAAATASQPRIVQHDSIAFGFHMRGDAPVIVSGVLAGSLADVSSARLVG